MPFGTEYLRIVIPINPPSFILYLEICLLCVTVVMSIDHITLTKKGKFYKSTLFKYSLLTMS